MRSRTRPAGCGADAPEGASAAGGPRAGRSLRIVVAEDDPVLRVALLEERGARGHAAARR